MNRLKIKIIFIIFFALTPAAIAAADCSQFANNTNLFNACQNLQRDVNQAQQDSLNSLNTLQKQNSSQTQTITPPPQTNVPEQTPVVQTQQPTTTPSPTAPRARIHY